MRIKESGCVVSVKEYFYYTYVVVFITNMSCLFLFITNGCIIHIGCSCCLRISLACWWMCEGPACGREDKVNVKGSCLRRSFKRMWSYNFHLLVLGHVIELILFLSR